MIGGGGKRSKGKKGNIASNQAAISAYFKAVTDDDDIDGEISQRALNDYVSDDGDVDDEISQRALHDSKRGVCDIFNTKLHKFRFIIYRPQLLKHGKKQNKEVRTIYCRTTAPCLISKWNQKKRERPTKRKDKLQKH